VGGVGAAVAGVGVNVDNRRGCRKHGEGNAQNGCPSLAVPRPRLNSASQNYPATPKVEPLNLDAIKSARVTLVSPWVSDWRRYQDKKHA
jgi:hypothetical protein